MRTSDSGVEFIKRHEGFRSEAYLDSVGVWTIGYGHTMNVKPGDSITEDEADSLLRAELIHYENAVERYVQSELTQNEFDALVSLCYNIGPANFSKSTVVRFINQGNKRGAAYAFELWDKGRIEGKLVILPGLAVRRRNERDLFLTT